MSFSTAHIPDCHCYHHLGDHFTHHVTSSRPVGQLNSYIVAVVNGVIVVALTAVSLVYCFLEH